MAFTFPGLVKVIILFVLVWFFSSVHTSHSLLSGSTPSIFMTYPQHKATPKPNAKRGFQIRLVFFMFVLFSLLSPFFRHVLTFFTAKVTRNVATISVAAAAMSLYAITAVARLLAEERGSSSSSARRR
jgi:hypothetical protein